MTTNSHEHAGWRFYALLVVVLTLWGSAFAAIRVVLRSGAYSPGHLTFVRLTIAAITLTAYALVRGTRLPAWRDVPMVILLGFTGFALYHTALNFGERTVTAGSASFIVALSPVFATLCSMVLLGDRPRAGAWLGMAIAFAGVTMIAMQESGGIRISSNALLILLSAMSGGFYIASQKPLLHKYQATNVVTWAMVVGAVLTSVFAPGSIHAIRTAPLSATLAVVYLGMFPAAIAYVLWSYALTHLPVIRVASALYLIPVATIIIATVWPGEWPKPFALAGGALALTGVVLVNRQPKK